MSEPITDEDSLAAFLFEKLDVYQRLEQAVAEAGAIFWKEMGAGLHTIAIEILGENWSPIFAAPAWEDKCNGWLYNPEWRLSLEGEAREAWELQPSFWFPEEGYYRDRLFGLGGGAPLHASIWAQPLSEYLGELEPVRAFWAARVTEPLRARGWEPYGDRVQRAKGDWGVRHPVRLDHRAVADGMRQGDLRPAFAPIEGLIEDFASVAPAIGEIVEEVREMKNQQRETNEKPGASESV